MNQHQLVSKSLFSHYPWDDETSVRNKICHPQNGPHLFFRCVKHEVKARFHELMAHDNIPQSLLFGSPHLDNYTKTDTGCGMIDFDRAYYGPYAWDIICFLTSLSLKQKTGFTLSKPVLNAFYDGYRMGLQLGEAPFEVYQPLANKSKKDWQHDITRYLASGKKWAKKLILQPIPHDDGLMNALASEYLTNLAEPKSIDDYQLIQAGRAIGTFGRTHNILLIQNKDDAGDQMLIDIKPTKSYLTKHWPHDQFYYSPMDHDGQRMIFASYHLAPEVTTGESYATVNGVEYWARHIPLQNEKIKTQLDVQEQIDLAYAVATQLGRGHALTTTSNASNIENHFKDNYSELQTHADKIVNELIMAWHYYQDIIALTASEEDDED